MHATDITYGRSFVLLLHLLSRGKCYSSAATYILCYNINSYYLILKLSDKLTTLVKHQTNTLLSVTGITNERLMAKII